MQQNSWNGKRQTKGADPFSLPHEIKTAKTASNAALGGAALLSAHEATHHTICHPELIDAIKLQMDQLGLTRKDLETLLGGRGRVERGVRERE